MECCVSSTHHPQHQAYAGFSVWLLQGTGAGNTVAQLTNHVPSPCSADRHRGPAADLDPEAARERALEVEFERERERRRRNEDEQRRRDEREYQRRLEFWERHERLVVAVQSCCCS